MEHVLVNHCLVPSPETVIQQERIAMRITGVHSHASKDLKEDLNASNICHFKDTFCRDWKNIESNIHVVIRFVYCSYHPNKVYIFYTAAGHSKSVEKSGKI